MVNGVIDRIAIVKNRHDMMHMIYIKINKSLVWNIKLQFFA